jgi:hypothetical protein
MRCRWFLFVPSVLLFAGVSAPGQPIPQPKDGKLVVPIRVSPEALPIPAMKYTLLPDLRDCQPGNQIPAFYKCFMERHAFYREKAMVDQREKWSTAPLADLANEKELVGYGGSGLRQADYAARLDQVDWGITHQLKTEGIALLLPDVQQLRELAGALKVRMRGEVARKDYDAAIRTAQTMLALGRAFNEHPTLIGHLVGIAITTITLNVVEELVQQPGAPNLFWALGQLPTPFIDLMKGMQGERAWLPGDFDGLRKADPIPEPELKRLVKILDGYMQLGETRRQSASAWYVKQAGNAPAAAAAKGRLAKAGHKADALDRLSSLQIVMMDDLLSYERLRDDFAKWLNVPYPLLPSELATVKAPEGVFTELAPSGLKVIHARGRLQAQIAMLQAVEAVRAYAAENGGKLPPSLEATKLPVPPDPFSGKPFVYEVSGDAAYIRATPPPDRKGEPAFNRVYEVTIAK